ncbi:hypothetical protein, partial [Ferrimicrobium sp.]|uniref:hypothetical protein n=1 Tax=Ferrimicrobium sp. TaxID=2926050 RepID=UPI002619C6C5
GGTSLVEVNPTTGASKVFYQNAAITGPVGIAINPSADIVWVTYYGTAANGSGSGYAVISNMGKLVANYTNTTSSYDGQSNLFEGAWGAAFAPGAFFWTNAGAATPNAQGTTGQVWRLNPNPTATTKNGQPINATYAPLATNLPTSDMSGTSLSPSTVAGPQGMVYDATNGTLYVTDDYNNAIYALPNALTATGPVTPVMIAQGGALNAPQGIAINPVNHDLFVVNGADNNNLVELTTTGEVVATRTLDGGSAGALFGLATTSMDAGHLGIYFDDSNTSTLDELSAPTVGYSGYQLAQSDGSVSAFGTTTAPAPTAPKVTGKVVGMAYAAGSGGTGYWEVTANGAVYAAGNAKNYGGVNNLRLNAPIVGIASTPDGKGYWLVGADGGVFNFGDAGYYGNTYSDGLTGLSGMHPLDMPVLGIIATPDGAGYWLVAKDGGVFNFGDAGFSGSGAGKGMTFTAAASPLL